MHAKVGKLIDYTLCVKMNGRHATEHENHNKNIFKEKHHEIRILETCFFDFIGSIFQQILKI